MAERPIAPVLKTGNTKVFEGSNPSPSALVFLRKTLIFCRFFAFVRLGKKVCSFSTAPARSCKRRCE